MTVKIKVAISGGPGTGKSTLAAGLFARSKVLGFDYDLIGEERRRLREEMGEYRNPFERFYMWRQQEREELRSSARDGFITDTPLFHFYTQAKYFANEKRDALAVRELLRMCLEIKAAGRYQVIVFPKKAEDISYRTDNVRTSTEEDARKKNRLIKTYVEHFWPDELLYIEGSIDERISMILERIKQLSSR